MTTTTITVNLTQFMTYFGADKLFDGITDSQLQSAYAGAGTFINTIAGDINLQINQQTFGVYLATAHCLTIMLNPNIAKGMVSNASQGNESLGYQPRPVKNWFDYQLGLTSYGTQLLAILMTVQPPVGGKPSGIAPYYSAIIGSYGS